MNTPNNKVVTDVQQLGAKLLSEAMREPNVDIVLTALTLTLAMVVNIVGGDHEAALHALKTALMSTEGNVESIRPLIREH